MNAADRYDSLFRYYAEKHGLDWLLLKAQAWQESRFNPDAQSPVGAKGLSQFMDRTWLEWRDGSLGIQEQPPKQSLSPFDPEDAIRSQAAMMAWLLRIFSGAIPKALASYNWGIGNVLKIARQGQSLPLARLPAETSDYIQKILAKYNEYAEQAGREPV